MPFFDVTEEDYKVMLKDARLLSSEYLRGRFKSSGTALNTVHRASEILLEQQAVAGMIATSFIKPSSIPASRVTWADKIEPTEKGHTAVCVAALLAAATPYLWLDEIRIFATTTTHLPNHSWNDLHAPYPLMWWRWEKLLDNLVSKLEHMQGYGLLVQFVERGINIIDISAVNLAQTNDNGTFQAAGLNIAPHFIEAEGLMYPKDFELYPLFIYEWIAKLCAFLNSPYVTTRRTPLVRSEQRRIGRMKVKFPNEMVGFVSLRREAVDGSDATTGPGNTLKFRDPISGHYKRHWWPKEKIHKLTWIADYMRGPDDAPIRSRAYKVLR